MKSHFGFLEGYNKLGKFQKLWANVLAQSVPNSIYNTVNKNKTVQQKRRGNSSKEVLHTRTFVKGEELCLFPYLVGWL